MTGQAKPRDPSIGVFSDDQLKRVLGRFGFDDFLVLPFFSINGAIIDLYRRTETARKVFVETASGVLFLKELPWYCASEEFAEYTTLYQEHLAARGVAVPRLWPGTSGARFVHDRLNGSIFTLQSYVNGVSWTDTETEAAAAGRALGGLHSAALSFRPDGHTAQRDVFTSSRELVELLHDASLAVDSASVREDLRRLTDESLATIEKCRDNAAANGYFATRMAVHGDFNPFNLLFDEQSGEVAAIVDFDNACFDHAAHDVAEAIVRFAWMRYRGLSSAYGEVPSGFAETTTSTILNAYESARDAALTDVQPFLSDVIAVIAVELGALGWLAGYYGPDDLAALTRNATSVKQTATDLLQEVFSR